MQALLHCPAWARQKEQQRQQLLRAPLCTQRPSLQQAAPPPQQAAWALQGHTQAAPPSSWTAQQGGSNWCWS